MKHGMLILNKYHHETHPFLQNKVIIDTQLENTQVKLQYYINQRVRLWQRQISGSPELQHNVHYNLYIGNSELKFLS